jgi:hypothetical protein
MRDKQQNKVGLPYMHDENDNENKKRRLFQREDCTILWIFVTQIICHYLGPRGRYS